MRGGPDPRPPASPRERRETRVLALLAATLAGLAAWQVMAGPEEEPLGIAMPVRPPAAPASPGSGPAGAAPDTAAILDRPLFSEARRRVAPIAVAQAAPPPPPAAPLSAEYTLLGLFRTEGTLVALLRQGGRGGAVLRLRAGEELGDWTLAGAEGARAVAFTRAGERQVLALPAAAAADARAAGSDDDDED